MDGTKVYSHARGQYGQPQVGLAVIGESLLAPHALQKTCIQAKEYLRGTQRLQTCLHALASEAPNSFSRWI